MHARGWVIKGVRSWMSDEGWADWLRPGRRGAWLTRRRVSGVEADAPAFLYKGAPDSCLVAQGRMTGEISEDAAGTFRVGVVVDRVFERPIPKTTLVEDAVLRDATFVKVGPVGTFYAITEAQVERIQKLSGGAGREPRSAAKRLPRREPAPRVAPVAPEKAASVRPALVRVERALTVAQPFAWALVEGHKTVENRSWQLQDQYVGLPIALHAGQKLSLDACEDLRVPPKGPLDLPDTFARGAIVGVVVFGAQSYKDEAAGWPRGDPRRKNPWWSGPWGWEVTEHISFGDDVIPCSGQLGLWRLPDDVREAVEKRVRQRAS